MKNNLYIIKVTATATSDNPNFAGEVRTYYFGKGQFLISNKTEPMDDALSKYLMTEYGYKRRGDAVRAAKFWDDTPDAKYWGYKTEIIEYTL